MATVVAAGNGNYLTGATWTGGSVPGNTDTAQTGAYTVTIDGNITATQIEATSSGHFEVTAGGITINANFVNGSSYATNGGLRCTHNSDTVTLNGTVSAAAQNGVGNNGTGTLTISGACTGTGAGHAVRNASTGIVNITGAVQAGTTGYGVSNVSTGTVNITGNVTSGSGNAGYGAYNYAGGTIAITGNVIAGTGSVAHAAYNNAAGTITVSGSATGGVAGGSGIMGAYNASTGTLTVNTAIGGAYVSSAGLHGDNSNGVTTYKSATAGTGGAAALSGFTKMVIDAAVNTITVKKSSDGSAYAMSNDYPAVTDVKSGVVYNRTTLTGTYVATGGGGFQQSGQGFGFAR